VIYFFHQSKEQQLVTTHCVVYVWAP